MIRRDVSNSKGLSRLSPRALALFLMLVPHYSSFGKMNGDPMFIKSEVVPLIPWLTLPAIRKALQEIDRETNVKWFEAEGRRYLHSLKWDEHQDLRTDRRGRDLIPSYPGEVRDKSGSSPGVVPPEVEVEGEGKKEVELEVPKTAVASAGASRPPLARPPGNGKDTATASGKEELPEQVSAILRLVDVGKRRSVEGIYKDVVSNRLKAESARTALLDGGISSVLVESLFPQATS